MDCDVCKQIDLETLFDPQGRGSQHVPHHKSLSNLLESTENKCPFCLEIGKALVRDRVDTLDSNGGMVKRYNSIWEPELPEDWKEYPIILETKAWQHPANWHFSIQSGEVSTSKISPKYRFGDFRMFKRRSQRELETGLWDFEDFFGRELSGRDVALRADSPRVFQIANAWLNQCVGAGIHHAMRHQLCCLVDLPSNFSFRRDENEVWICDGHLRMPSRTIDLGPPDGSCRPFLADHSSDTESEPWAALSHCWGTSKPLVTTWQSIESHKAGIEMAALPRTFQDAIRVTRELGIRHLWIDSLCIIQDSPADWRVESNNMARVYRHALVNIAAGSSSDCNSGFLHGERTAVSQDCCIPLQSIKYGAGNLFVGRTHGVWSPSRCYSSRPYYVAGDSLHQRAWVLQETTLSPRTLHFNADQLFWECCEKVNMEGCIAPVSPTFVNEEMFFAVSQIGESQKKFFIRPPPTILSTPENKDRHRRVLYHRWYSLISDFSRRRLTFPADMFPALSGVARTMQSMLGDRYIAGIFDGDLIRGLLWMSHQRFEDVCTTVQHAYRAPSWSWASRHNDVYWASFILDDLLSKSPLRQPGPATLIRADIDPVPIVDQPSSEPYFGSVGSALLVIHSLYRRAAHEDFLFAGGTFTTRSAKLDDIECSSFEEMVENYGNMFLLYMGIFNRTMYALILTPADRAERNYRRIGIFVRSAAWFEECMHKWSQQEVSII